MEIASIIWMKLTYDQLGDSLSVTWILFWTMTPRRSYREKKLIIRFSLRFDYVFCEVQNTKPYFKTISSRNHEFFLIIWWDFCS